MRALISSAPALVKSGKMTSFFSKCHQICDLFFPLLLHGLLFFTFFHSVFHCFFHGFKVLRERHTTGGTPFRCASRFHTFVARRGGPTLGLALGRALALALAPGRLGSHESGLFQNLPYVVRFVCSHYCSVYMRERFSRPSPYVRTSGADRADPVSYTHLTLPTKA